MLGEVLNLTKWQRMATTYPIGTFAYFGNNAENIINDIMSGTIKPMQLIAVIEHDEYPFVFNEPEDYRDDTLVPTKTRSMFILPIIGTTDEAVIDTFSTKEQSSFPSFLVVGYPDLTMVEYMTEKLIKAQGYGIAGSMFYDGECYLQPLLRTAE